ncbi:hypothetical protein V8E36_002390 [Tilletia maclaganii]
MAARLQRYRPPFNIIHMNKNGLTVLQYNCHNDPEVVAALINHPKAHSIDILCLQEPHTYFPLHFPRERECPARPRVLTYVNKKLRTANVNQVGVQHPDLITLEVLLNECDPDGIERVTISNVYNPVRSSDSILPLLHSINHLQPRHHILVGDVNAHHPLWQTNVRSVSRHAEAWVTASQAMHLELVTPPDTPTFLYGHARALSSTIDLCFSTDELRDRVISCAPRPDLDTGSDHQPVATTFDLSPVRALPGGRFNMRRCDHARFVEEAKARWDEHSEALPALSSPEGVEKWAETLRRCITAALEASTPLSRPSHRSQAWFDEECNQLRTFMNRARRLWQQRRDDAARTYYVFMRNLHKATLRAKKKQHRRVAFASADVRSLWKLASAGKKAGGVGIVSELRTADGRLASCCRSAAAEARLTCEDQLGERGDRVP